MKAFAALYTALDETNSTNRKVDALAGYFRRVPAEDAAWTVSFLIGRKPRQVVPARRLMEWAAQLAGIPEWLFESCYDVVGDLAETITLLLPRSGQSSPLPLHKLDPESQRREIEAAWRQMNTAQRFVWNKLITGGFRVGVSQKLVVRALAEVSGIEAAVIAHRLMGHWSPSEQFFENLLSADTRDADISRPYPFYLAYPLDAEIEQLGDPADWQVEWKWDGIRGQLIQREGQVFLWSRGEEMVTGTYPELAESGRRLPPGTVIDGEILAWKHGAPLPFSELQRRIGRKQVGKKLLEEVPVILLAYDLLEHRGRDIRRRPLQQRRAALADLLAELGDPTVSLSPEVDAAGWAVLAEMREQARSRAAEGFMLKHRNSAYGVGRKRGDWWKWKVDPFTVDAVMIYAQRGHGRRSGLYTDYTFAVRDGSSLVPFAKAYSGLTDAEIRQVDRFIQRNTTERFGPVRAVKPELVFEIAFEGIQPSARHKSGVAVRFPRIARWRTDKPVGEIDTLDTLKALLEQGPGQ